MQPWLRLIPYLLGLLCLAYYADGWKTDNRVGIWLQGREGLKDYHILQENFQGDEMALIRLLPDSADDLRTLQLAQQLGPRLLHFPSVVQVVDPFRLPGAQSPGKVDSWQEALERPLGRTLGLASTSPLHLDFLLLLEPTATQATRNQLARKIEQLRKEAASLQVNMQIAGHPLVAAALDKESQQVQKVFAPLLAVVATCGVWLLLRSLPLALLSVLPALLGASAIRAAFRFLGWDANLILVSAGPLMLVILLASTLHLSSAYLNFLRQGVDPKEAAIAARKEKFSAGMLAALTTSIGFFVFLSSPLEPVRRLGIGVGLGVFLFVSFFYYFLPQLLPLVKKAPTTRPSFFLPTLLEKWATKSCSNPLPWISLACAFLLAGVFSFYHLETNTNALRYFPESNQLKQDFSSIESLSTGMSTTEVLVSRADGKPWSFPSAELDEIDSALENGPSLVSKFGPATVIEDVLQTQPDFSWQNPLHGVLLNAGMHQSNRLGREGLWARWTLRMPSENSKGVTRMVHRIQEQASSWDCKLGCLTVVTGTLPLLLDMQEALIGTLVRSLGLTLAATFFLFLFVTRHWRQRIGVMVVNLVPVSCSLLAAWLLGFELDGASVMVAAVVLSLAVDNTFHLLYAFGKTSQNLEGLGRSFRQVGPPAAISACALALGFLSLAYSGFTPTARFGLLTAIGASASLPADLILLPTFLLKAKR